MTLFGPIIYLFTELKVSSFYLLTEGEGWQTLLSMALALATIIIGINAMFIHQNRVHS